MRDAGYTLGRDLIIAAYDWRYEAASHVGRVDAAVATALANTGAPSLDIIAHSMGTQVTRAFLKSGTLRDRVANAALAGSPAMGTAKGAIAVIAGTCAHELGPLCFLPPNHVQYVLRTMGGGLDQAPSRTYYQVFDGRDSRHPIVFVDRTLATGPVPAQTYDALCDIEVSSGVYLSPLTAAEAFHADDGIWLSPTAGSVRAPVSLFVGTGQCTIGQIVKRTQPVFVPSADGRPTFVGFRTSYDTKMIDGDGTVVRQRAAVKDPGSGFGNFQETPTWYRRLDHGGLVEKGMNVILDALYARAQPLLSPVQPTCGVFGIGSPMEFELTDSAGRRLGGSSPNSIAQDIPGGSYDRFADMKVAALHVPGAYTATLSGSGQGDTTVRVRWIANGSITREAVFLHVPTQPRSRGRITFDTANGTVSDLDLDVDGDGVVDLHLHPLLLTGAAAGDETPPLVILRSPSTPRVVGRVDFAWVASDPESGINTSFAMIDRESASPVVIPAQGAVDIAPGVHVIEAFAENGQGLLGTTKTTVIALSYAWSPPLTKDQPLVENAGRTIPVKFVVTDSAGRFVADQSVALSMLDAAGRTVVGPLTAATQPSDGVKVDANSYHADVSTKGLSAGTYTIEAKFGSADLSGRLLLSVTLR